MGPYVYEKQLERINSIESLLKQENLKDDVREMWTRILNRIALNEDDYNARVMFVYRDFPKEVLIQNA